MATEDLAYLLTRSGFPTGVDVTAAAQTGLWIADQLGITAPAQLGRAGPFPPRSDA
jgi:hydroxymethylglutaryl-CoA lyase